MTPGTTKSVDTKSVKKVSCNGSNRAFIQSFLIIVVEIVLNVRYNNVADVIMHKEKLRKCATDENQDNKSETKWKFLLRTISQ